MFEIKDIPPGKYYAIPAGEPQAKKQVNVSKKAWYEIWREQETKDLGTISIPTGEKIKP